MAWNVVNVKVANIRPKYANLKLWCEDPSNVYIGRRGIVFVDGQRFPTKESIFANPFKIGKVHKRNDVVEQYRAYALERIRKDPVFTAAVLALRGKTLGCWCAPERCHGQVLAELCEDVCRSSGPKGTHVTAVVATAAPPSAPESTPGRKRPREDDDNEGPIE